MHKAAKKDYDKVLRLLIRHGAFLDPIDQSGSTPLITASSQGATKCVRILLEHGADHTIALKVRY